MNRRNIAAAGAAVAALFIGGVVVNETLLAGCGADVCLGDAWQAKYLAADISAGDKVLTVQAGSHAFQQLDYDPSKATAVGRVIFKPAGGLVTISGLQSGKVGSSTNVRTGAARWELRDIKVTADVKLRWGSDDVVLRNIDAPAFIIHSSKNVSVLGGDWGPSVGGISSVTTCQNSPCPGVSNILIDGALFHDYLIADPADHAECLMLWPNRASSGIVVRNSVFRGCTDLGILVKAVALNGGNVIENNMVDKPMPGTVATVGCSPGCPRSGSSLALSDGKGFIVRHNSFLGGFRIDSTVSGVTQADNLANASPALFVDGDASNGSMDLHLAAGASAIDTGTSSLPATDIDGQARPNGPKSDIGADEFGGASPPPPDPTETTPTEPPPPTTEPPPTTTEPPPTTTEPPPTTSEPPPTTTEPPPTTTAPPTYSLSAEYDLLETTSTHERWRKANPNEAVKVETYWRSGGVKPVVATSYGRFLINTAQELRR